VPDEQPETIVERDEVAVMFKRVADQQAAIERGWVELEEAVGSLRGRKFFGAFDETSREYRVCVQRRESDRPAALGLEVGTLPRGRYARVRLQGEPPAVYELRECHLRERGDPAKRAVALPENESPAPAGLSSFRRVRQRLRTAL
jgi:hypothetical protein